MTIVDQQPKLALAVSGGGLRASLYGAGTISALDHRNSSTAGGLLQLADYRSGLSGGSWTVTSLALNDLEEVYPMVLGINSSIVCLSRPPSRHSSTCRFARRPTA